MTVVDEGSARLYCKDWGQETNLVFHAVGEVPMDTIPYPAREHRKANITMLWSMCKGKPTALTTITGAANNTSTKYVSTT